MKKSLAIALLVTSFHLVFGQLNQPIRFQHITSENGLSQGHILCMMQDREGYIWIGTYFGLNRYNGYSINFYTENQKDPSALKSKVVYSIFEDKDGYLWVGTVGGLDKFDKKTEKFTHIPNNGDAFTNGNHENLSDWYVHIIKQDKYGNIWVGTDRGGINKIDYKTQKITYFKRGFGTPDTLGANQINDLLIDQNNHMWIATEGGGLSCMDLDNYSVKTYCNSARNNNSLSTDNITCLFETRDGIIWIGSTAGILASLDKKTDRFVKHNFLPKQFRNSEIGIRDIAQDKFGNLLLGTMGAGLVIYNPATQVSQVNMHNFKDPATIISNEVYSILVDRTGTVFVGTYGMGISRYSPGNRKFPIYFMHSNSGEGDKNSYTECIEDSYGRLIIGSYNGFNVYDRKTNINKHYLPGKTYEENKILTIALAPDGDIWMGSDHSLHRYDKNFKKVKSYVIINDKKDHPIYSIYFDHLHNLWFGLFSIEGLFKVSEAEWKNKTKNTLSYKLYKTNPNDTTTISGDQVWCIKQDKKLNLWTADNQGVCRYSYEKDNFTRLKITQMPKTLEFDKDDNLWVASRGEGVFFYNTKTNEIKQYTKNEGLAENFVFGAIVDKNNDVWFNTENGLSRFTPKTERFRNYDIYDGLPNNRFDDRSERLLSQGQIYMGTAQGFVIFNPDNIKDDPSKPNIVLTDIKISNISVTNLSKQIREEIVKTPVELVPSVNLYPGQRDFAFEFASLDYGAPRKIKYSYKLEGFDKEWINTDAKNRIARYTNLDGGNYVFMVKGTNSDGVWNDKPLTISVTIHPPFFETVWFRVIVILGIIISVILAFSLKIVNEIKQKQKLAKLVAERTREITEMNNLLIVNTNDLSETNSLLEERQQYIEAQKEELSAHRDELARLNAQKDKLFSIIAHDLKNPFNVIMGYADLLLVNNKNYDAEKRHKFLAYLQQSSHNAYLLLENLLQWSRAQSGTLIFDPLPVKIDKLIAFSIKQTADLAEKKNVKVLFDHTTKDVVVHADENMINTVLRNLFTNAIKFSHKGGNIMVYLEKNETHAQISVVDQGVGMTNEVRDNLFQFNKNASIDGTVGEKGTGLGMILCKDFIDANKGQIWVESELGKGSAFTFSLPLEN